MTSRNLSKEKREKLIAKIQEQAQKVDDETKAVFNEVINELNKKKYGIVWEEHSEEVKDEMTTKIPVFVEDKGREIKQKDLETYNFILEGDNLHSLKLLEKTHKNKIDVIYIDPPYNTGAKDWKYNNDYVDSNDGYRHSKWLSFMKERFEIAKKLLSNSGIIICAIDHYELFQLGMLMNDIFGEENRLGVVTVVHKPEGRNQEKYFATSNEFALFYSKDIKHAKFQKVIITEEKQSEFSYSDEQGKYRLEPLIAKNHGRKGEDKNLRINRPHKFYPIYVSKNGELSLEKKEKWYEVLPITSQERTWKYDKATCQEEINKGNIVAVRKGLGFEILNKYRESKGELIKTHWIKKEYNANTSGTRIVKDILGKNLFDFPKSIYLMKDIIKIVSRKNSIVLDYFAGSGTTGQAVLELNDEDNGCRRFILCTNNENNICEEVTYPRIKTVITGIREDGSKYSDGLLANLKYYKPGYVNKEKDGSVPNTLLKHVKELVQLENLCDIDNKTIILALSEEELDKVLNSNLSECRKLYIPTDVLLTFEQKEIIKKNRIEVINIPEYYFSQELMEVDEI